MTVLEVAEELQRLIELGNSGKLGTQDLEGGTFTLSNIGTVSVVTFCKSRPVDIRFSQVLVFGHLLYTLANIFPRWVPA